MGKKVKKKENVGEVTGEGRDGRRKKGMGVGERERSGGKEGRVREKMEGDSRGGTGGWYLSRWFLLSSPPHLVSTFLCQVAGVEGTAWRGGGKNGMRGGGVL